jgi:hypothetical protein
MKFCFSTQFDVSNFFTSFNVKATDGSNLADFVVPSILILIFAIIEILVSISYKNGEISLAYMLLFIITGGLCCLLSITMLLFEILYPAGNDATKKNTKNTVKLSIIMAIFIIIFACILLSTLMYQGIIKIAGPESLIPHASKISI